MSKDCQPYPLERPFWAFIAGLSLFLIPFSAKLLLPFGLIILIILIKVKELKLLTLFAIGCLWAWLFAEKSPQNLRPLGGMIKLRIIDSGIIDGQAGNREIKTELIHFESHGQVQIADKKILLNSPITTQLFYGDIIEAEGALVPIEANFPNEKGYHRHLNNQGYYRIFYPASEEDIIINPSTSLRKKTLSFRDSLLNRIKNGVQSESNYRVLAAMLFGLKQELGSDQKDTLRKSGLMHIFAVSGLHVGIVSVIILYLMRLVMIPVWKRYMLLPFLLLPYLIMTGLPASGLRAWIMISVWATGMCLKRASISLNSLYCAGFLILIINPMQLLLTGFQFSFLVIFCLLCSSKSLDELCRIINEKDAWGGRASYHLEHMKNNLVKAFAISAIAFLCSFAMTIHLSANSNPFSLTVNLICIFLAAPLMLCALLASLIPPLFPLLNSFTEFFAGLAELSSNFALKPGVLSGLETLIYSLIFMLIIRVNFPYQKKIFAMITLVLGTCSFIYISKAEDKIIISRVPGQEQSEIAIFTNNQALIINCTDYSSVSFIAKEMDRRGIDRAKIIFSNRRKSSAKGIFTLLNRDRISSIHYSEKSKSLTPYQKYLTRQCFEREIPIYYGNHNASPFIFKDHQIIWGDFKIKIFSYKTGICLIKICGPNIDINRELPVSNHTYVEEFLL